MEGCFTFQWGGAPWGGNGFDEGGGVLKKIVEMGYPPMPLPLWETLSRQKFSFSIIANVSTSYSRYKSIVKYFLQ